MNIQHFAVIGKDQRLIAAADALREQGFSVSVLQENEIEKATQADALLLPLPLSRDGVHVSNTAELSVCAVLNAAGKDTPIFAGLCGGFCDPRLIDYAKEDVFALLNAVPTAEGALAIVLSQTDITVRGMRVAITGFGKVAQAVAALFSAAGADITVIARKKEARAHAQSLGYTALPFTALSERIAWDTLVSTVPEKIITADILSGIPKETLILDLASAPGSVDFMFAEKNGNRAIHALALPQKYSPKTAGRAVAESILAILAKKNTP